MNKSGKTSTLFLLLLVVISIAAAAYLYMEWDKGKKEITNLQGQITDLENKKQEIEKKYKDTLIQVEDLSKKMKDAEVQVASLAENLDSANKSKEEALAEVEKVKQELIEITGSKDNLVKELSDAKKELQVLKGKLKFEEQTKKQSSQDAARSDVQLDKIVVAPADNQPAIATIGRVLVVNRDYDFAVVNLGQGDNIKVGDKLSVVRDNKIIGSLQIEEIRPTMSVAKFDSQGIKENIKEGDNIAL
jgi:peptidoglycan hydrolase CwlO-like protein